MAIDAKQLYQWCKVPCRELEGHPGLKVPFRLVEDSAAMGQLMARELVDEIKAAGGESFRAIIPCGPSCWYQPFTDAELIQQAVNFVLSQDITGLCTVGDTRVLPLVLQACENYTAMSENEQEALIATAEAYEPLFA